MRPAAATTLVFFASASVLVLEILAGRLVAPYVGVSLETFTGIIGVVLAGISVGSWLGGRAADIYDPAKLLGPILVAGGATAIAAPFLVDLIGTAVGTGPGGIVVLATVGFFVPAAILSAVTPTVVKLTLSDLGKTGSVVGRFSAIATAGAIFGTFFTGFVLIASVPTRPLVWVVGTALAAWGLGLSSRLGSWLGRTAIVAILAGAGMAAAGSAVLGWPCDLESAYSCARVVPDADDPTRRLLLLDTVRHSFVDTDDPTYLEFRYINMLAAVAEAIAPEPAPLDVLYIGGGGFTLPRYVQVTRPGSTAVVLEIDPALVALNENELGLVLDADLVSVDGDARITLVDQPEAAYDYVVGDAYSGLSVPWHLTTVEYLTEVERRLRPGGTFAMNVLDGVATRYLRSQLATVQEVFTNVALIALPEQIAGERGGNFVLIGSNGPIATDVVLADMADRGYQMVAVTGSELDELVDGATVLRDDFAPVDQLLTR